MTYRASNQRHIGEVTSASTNLNNAYRIIKEVLKKFRSREAEEKERANLVEQDNLVIDPGKSAFRLRDLYIRPNIVAKRITGEYCSHIGMVNILVMLSQFQLKMEEFDEDRK